MPASSSSSSSRPARSYVFPSLIAQPPHSPPSSDAASLLVDAPCSDSGGVFLLRAACPWFADVDPTSLPPAGDGKQSSPSSNGAAAGGGGGGGYLLLEAALRALLTYCERTAVNATHHEGSVLRDLRRVIQRRTAAVGAPTSASRRYDEEDEEEDMEIVLRVYGSARTGLVIPSKSDVDACVAVMPARALAPGKDHHGHAQPKDSSEEEGEEDGPAQSLRALHRRLRQPTATTTTTSLAAVPDGCGLTNKAGGGGEGGGMTFCSPEHAALDALGLVLQCTACQAAPTQRYAATSTMHHHPQEQQFLSSNRKRPRSDSESAAAAVAVDSSGASTTPLELNLTDLRVVRWEQLQSTSSSMLAATRRQRHAEGGTRINQLARALRQPVPTTTTQGNYRGGASGRSPRAGPVSSPCFHGIQRIAHASVPIVKCQHSATNMAVDLSFSCDGLRTSFFLNRKFQQFPIARGLTLLLKALLQERNLNDASVGGLGSYPLSLLVVFFVENVAQETFGLVADRTTSTSTPGGSASSASPSELLHWTNGSYAVFLIAFLQFYGFGLDLRTHGIDLPRRKIFSKPHTTELVIFNPIPVDDVLFDANNNHHHNNSAVPTIATTQKNVARAATKFSSQVVPYFQELHQRFVALSAPTIESLFFPSSSSSAHRNAQTMAQDEKNAIAKLHHFAQRVEHVFTGTLQAIVRAASSSSGTHHHQQHSNNNHHQHRSGGLYKALYGEVFAGALPPSNVDPRGMMSSSSAAVMPASIFRERLEYLVRTYVACVASLLRSPSAPPPEAAAQQRQQQQQALKMKKAARKRETQHDDRSDDAGAKDGWISVAAPPPAASASGNTTLSTHEEWAVHRRRPVGHVWCGDGQLYCGDLITPLSSSTT